MPDQVGELVTKLTADTSNFRQGMEEVGRVVEETAAKLSAVGDSLTKGLTVPLTVLAGLSIRSAESMNRLSQGLEQVTGSAAATGTQLERLKRISAVPGLNTKDLISASTMLQSVGFSAFEAASHLKIFGTALAAAGRGERIGELAALLADMRESTELSANQIQRLRDLLPQFSQAAQRAFGTAVPKEIVRSFSGQEVIAGLRQEIGDELGHIAQDLAVSSRDIRDSLEDLAASVGNILIPAIQPLVDNLATLANEFATNDKEVGRWLTSMGVVGAVIGPALSGLDTLVTGVKHLKTILAAASAGLVGFVARTGAARGVLGVLASALALSTGQILALLAAIFGIGTALVSWRIKTAQADQAIRDQAESLRRAVARGDQAALSIHGLTEELEKAEDALKKTKRAGEGLLRIWDFLRGDRTGGRRRALITEAGTVDLDTAKQELAKYQEILSVFQRANKRAFGEVDTSGAEKALAALGIAVEDLEPIMLAFSMRIAELRAIDELPEPKRLIVGMDLAALSTEVLREQVKRLHDQIHQLESAIALGGKANEIDELNRRLKEAKDRLAGVRRELSGRDLTPQLQLERLRFPELIELQDQLRDKAKDLNRQLAATDTNTEAWVELEEQLGDVDRMLAVVGAAFMARRGEDVPQIDIGGVPAIRGLEEIRRRWQEFRDQAGVLELRVEAAVDPAAKAKLQAALDDVRMEAERAQAALDFVATPTMDLTQLVEAGVSASGIVEQLTRQINSIQDEIDSQQIALRTDISDEDKARIRMELQRLLTQKLKLTIQVEEVRRRGDAQREKITRTYNAQFEILTKRAKELDEALKDTSGGLVKWLKGVGGSLKEMFDPKEFVSNLAANLATGGFNALFGAAQGLLNRGISALGDALFGSGEAISQNTQAMQMLEGAIRDMGEVLAGTPIGGMISAFDAARATVGRWREENIDLQSNWDPDRFNPFNVQPGAGGPRLGQEFREELRNLGITWEEFTRLAADLGFNIEDADFSLAAFIDRLRSIEWEQIFGTIQGQLRNLQRTFDLFDIDPEDQIQQMTDLLVGHLRGGLQELVSGIDWQDPTEDLREIWRKFQADEINLEDLRGLSITAFLDWIGQIEGLADSAYDASDGLNRFGDALRNVPRGFKVALARFQADTGRAADELFTRGPGTEDLPATDRERSIPGTDVVVRAADKVASATRVFASKLDVALSDDVVPAVQYLAARLRAAADSVSFGEVDVADRASLPFDEAVQELARTMLAEVRAFNSQVGGMEMDVAMLSQALQTLAGAVGSYRLPSVDEAEGVARLDTMAVRAATGLRDLLASTQEAMRNPLTGEPVDINADAAARSLMQQARDLLAGVTVEMPDLGGDAVVSALAEIATRLREQDVRVGVSAQLETRDLEASVAQVARLIAALGSMAAGLTGEQLEAPTLEPVDVAPLRQSLEEAAALVAELGGLAARLAGQEPVVRAPELDTTGLQASVAEAGRVSAALADLAAQLRTVQPDVEVQPVSLDLAGLRRGLDEATQLSAAIGELTERIAEHTLAGTVEADLDTSGVQEALAQTEALSGALSALVERVQAQAPPSVPSTPPVDTTVLQASLEGASVFADAVMRVAERLRGQEVGVDGAALDVSRVQRSIDALALTAPVLPPVDLGPLALFNEAALRAAYQLDLLAFSTESLLVAGGLGAQPLAGTMLPVPLTAAPAAPPLGTGEEGVVPSGSTFSIQSLTVIANDPDEMLTKIEQRARQRSRLGGVSGLDLAVAPVGQRGTPTGVR